MKFKNQDLHDLFLETSELIYARWKINSNCKYLALFH